MPNRPKVGEILLRAGVIDKFQLNAALGEQARWGRPLGATLVKLGFLEERDLVRALASQLDMPVASLEGKRIHADVLALVPRSIAEQHMVIPLFVKNEGGRDHLYVGVEDPGNLEVLDDLAFRTGMEVRPVMVSPSELWEGIDRYYRREIIATVSEVEPEPTLDATPSPSAVVTSGTEELAKHWTMPAQGEEAGAPIPSATTPSEPAVAQPISEPAPETAAVSTSTPAPVDPSAPLTPSKVDPSASAPPLAPSALVEPAQVNDAPEAGETTQPLVDVVATPEVAPLRESDAPRAQSGLVSAEERTRIALEALTQILLEKGVMTREELHQRIRELVQALSGSA